MTTATPTPPGAARSAMRHMVKNFYDLQRLRIQSGGRKRAKHIELSQADIDYYENVEGSFRKLEKYQLTEIRRRVKAHPLWAAFLEGVKGCGETMSGVILSEIDIHACDTVSRLWNFAGLGVWDVGELSCGHEGYRIKHHEVVKDGNGNAKRDEEDKLVTVQKIEWRCPKCGTRKDLVKDLNRKAAMKRVAGVRLPYNAHLRTKLLGVLGGCMLKASGVSDDPGYAKFFYDYRNRLKSEGWGKSDGHRKNAAIRYMVKMFLLDLYKEWRTLEGLPVREPYAEEYLGKRHAV